MNVKDFLWPCTVKVILQILNETLFVACCQKWGIEKKREFKCAYDIYRHTAENRQRRKNDKNHKYPLHTIARNPISPDNLVDSIDKRHLSLKTYQTRWICGNPWMLTLSIQYKEQEGCGFMMHWTVGNKENNIFFKHISSLSLQLDVGFVFSATDNVQALTFRIRFQNNIWKGGRDGAQLEPAFLSSLCVRLCDCQAVTKPTKSKSLPC